jgi:hypothetical protein
MALIAAERLNKNHEKGMGFYEKALKFCKENFSGLLLKMKKKSKKAYVQTLPKRGIELRPLPFWQSSCYGFVVFCRL